MKVKSGQLCRQTMWGKYVKREEVPAMKVKVESESEKLKVKKSESEKSESEKWAIVSPNNVGEVCQAGRSPCNESEK